MMYGLNVFVNVSTVLPYQRNKVNSSSLPNHVDWRLKGYVTKVKDQVINVCKACSQRAHDVNITSPQRRCNVMTLHRRLGDVIFGHMT